MNLREPYKGYVLSADPARCRGAFTARVVIELHERGAVHYQEVSADPFVRYGTRKEAERASLEFGKALIDSRPSTPSTPTHP
jgi:hypothetical protein